MRRLALSLLLAATALVSAAPSAAAAGGWSWPVAGPVIRGFDPPDSPYGAGHRGIDIAVPVGTPIFAPATGTVTFAGKVGGHLFLTVNHGGGVASTYSWLLELRAHKGDVVTAGTLIALTGWAHPGSLTPSLHFGVKLGADYLDPLAYLAPGSVVGFIRLAPLGWVA